jgi:methanethiol S-methyltransferase
MQYFYSVPIEHIILAAGWILFCILHSVLASGRVKRYTSATHPHLSKYYRFYYTLFAAITFIAVVIYELRLPSPLLLPAGFRSFGYPVSIGGAVIMLICIRKYFTGLTGLKALFNKEPFHTNLEITGIHKYVRHPLYLGTFLFIWGLFFIIPHLSVLVSNAIITIYTIIGIYYEEEKLVDEFGDEYRSYQEQVPRLIPFSRRMRSAVKKEGFAD